MVGGDVGLIHRAERAPERQAGVVGLEPRRHLADASTLGELER